MDEADIETHDHAHEPADDPRYLGAFTDRVARMVLRDRNHPSVVVWSPGNESDYGANHDAAAGRLRRTDPTRPVQYEGSIKDAWEEPQSASGIMAVTGTWGAGTSGLVQTIDLIGLVLLGCPRTHARSRPLPHQR